jgi:hypothetical protein
MKVYAQSLVSGLAVDSKPSQRSADVRNAASSKREVCMHEHHEYDFLNSMWHKKIGCGLMAKMIAS